MFGWLKKLTGGGRIPAPPPYVYSGPALPAADLSDSAPRPAAPLVFAKPATIDPFTSMSGMVRLARKDEPWPMLEGAPMDPLLQINLTQAPMVPGALHDLSLITVFIADAQAGVPTMIIDSRNADPDANWVLRSYDALDGLTIPHPPTRSGRVSPLLGEWAGVVEQERPEYEDARGAPTIPVQTKLGGWPDFAQAKPWWAEAALTDTWDFVLQIGFGPAAGVAAIARSRERPHLWAIDVERA